jgi:Cd2+/Zn2+-exporting ATPase
MSGHPLGAAVLKEAERRGLKLEDAGDFKVDEGLGVSASVGGRVLHVGSARYMKRLGVALPEAVASSTAEHKSGGRGSILLSCDGRLRGAIWVWDPPRKGAAEAIAELRKIGVERIALLTGDNRFSAKRVADLVGISEVHAEMLPHEKLDWVKSLKREGYRVAFVGDGVNDAPALAAADVGVAMGARGTDVAMETADVALMADDLSRVAESIYRGRKAISIIRQNAVFALTFNLVMVVLAASGTLGMVAGAIVHQASSLGVILNSMRLFIGRRSGNP